MSATADVHDVTGAGHGGVDAGDVAQSRAADVVHHHFVALQRELPEGDALLLESILDVIRQKDIRDDTDKLFQLATELKAAVDKTNENLLSLDVVRKADEVEKLAKKVKEKMKDAIGPPVKDPVRTLPNPNFPH